MAASERRPAVAVVGAGNGGMAFAASMALQGAAVRLCDALPEAIAPLAEGRTITLEHDGRSEDARIERATLDAREAVTGAHLVMMVVPASAHAAVAQAIAPFLEPDAVVVLNPGRTGGALEIRKVLAGRGVSPDVTVAEAQTLLFACRRKGTRVVVSGTKRSVPVAALPVERTARTVEALNRFFPQFTAASSVLETSLGNIGAIFHPAPTLLNTGRIESTAGKFQYYVDGISPSVARLLERADGERIAIARALGVPPLPALRWIEQAYGLSRCATLYDAIQLNAAYRGIMAPTSIDVRYVTEDVPTGLVPLASIARHANVATPVMDTIVELACQLLERDFWTEGRNVTKLGLEEAFPELVARGRAPLSAAGLAR